MGTILVIGGGQIGQMISWLLVHSGDYGVTVADRSEEALARLDLDERVGRLVLDATDETALARAMDGHYAVISAAPYHVTKHVAQAAKQAGLHYLDLTEDVATKDMVKGLAKDAATAFIPQCGLAPGFISIVGHALASRFDTVDTLRLRVGALPLYPANAIGYNLTWNTDGVINEYLRPCEAIIDGQHTYVPPLEELEHFALQGVQYEAFNTSGGLGTLCESLDGHVRYLNYRTIRYPGHRDAMKMLLQDLRLGDRPEIMKDILEQAIPTTLQDVVVIFVTAIGQRDGRLMQESYANHVYARESGGRIWTGIQVTTASAVCAVLDMLHNGGIPDRGFVRQEQISLERFLANRFGHVYDPHGPAA